MLPKKHRLQQFIKMKFLHGWKHLMAMAGGFYAHKIKCRTSVGTIREGWVFIDVLDKDKCPLFTPIHYCAYGKEVISGKTYYIFKMRRQEEVYNGSAVKIGVVSKGTLVLTDGNISGQTRPHWLRVCYKRDSDSGRWIQLNGGSAFLDMGFDIGTLLTSTSSLIGSL